MTDLDRLRQWMAQRELNISTLARELSLSRHTVYACLEVRKSITYKLVTHFAQRYGTDEARAVFQGFYAPLEAELA